MYVCLSIISILCGCVCLSVYNKHIVWVCMSICDRLTNCFQISSLMMPPDIALVQCACVCVWVWVSERVCVCEWASVRACVCMCACTCMCAHVRVHVRACVYLWQAYKLFPNSFINEAPRYCINSGSLHWSPTMVGPNSCRQWHAKCIRPVPFSNCWQKMICVTKWISSSLNVYITSLFGLKDLQLAILSL